MADDEYPKPRYAWYVLGVLTLVYIFSFLDRQILSLLVAPIRRDLHISDTQISLLSGFSFAIFYVAFGIPLGRVADSRNRSKLITIGFASWSLFTGACGLAGNFVQLALMRMGVGVGEATLSPAAYSLITDYFPPRRRAIAQGIYNMGIYVGSGIALVLGGVVTGIVAKRPDYVVPLLGAMRSWQVVFLVIGGIGVLVVPVMFTVREPVRQHVGASGAVSIPLARVAAYVRGNLATYGCHNVGIAMLSFSSYGISAWMPTYIIRNFHWTAAHIGVTMGVRTAIFGSIGVVGGGYIADRMAARGHKDAYIAKRFPQWSILGADIRFDPYVVHDAIGNYACMDAEGEVRYFHPANPGLATYMALYKDPSKTFAVFRALFEQLLPRLPETDSGERVEVTHDGARMVRHAIQDYATPDLHFVQAGIGAELAPVDCIRLFNVLMYFDADFRRDAEWWALNTVKPGGIVLCGGDGAMSTGARYSVYERVGSELVEREFAFSIDNVRPATINPWFCLQGGERETFVLAKLTGVLRRDEAYRTAFDARLDALFAEERLWIRRDDGALVAPPDQRPAHEWLSIRLRMNAQLIAEGFVTRAVDVLKRAGYHAWENSVGHIAVSLPQGYDFRSA